MKPVFVPKTDREVRQCSLLPGKGLGKGWLSAEQIVFLCAASRSCISPMAWSLSVQMAAAALAGVLCCLYELPTRGFDSY